MFPYYISKHKIIINSKYTTPILLFTRFLFILSKSRFTFSDADKATPIAGGSHMPRGKNIVAVFSECRFHNSAIFATVKDLPKFAQRKFQDCYTFSLAYALTEIHSNF